MERELWPRLYHLVMEVGQTLRLGHIIRCRFIFSGKNDELTPDFSL